MKETKIAKENIKDILISKEILEEHKQTCERWLGWLEDWFSPCEGCCPDTFKSEIKPKMIDLEQAIELYEGLK